MSYSNSFPTQRPTLNLDFANSGKLDSRISYSRSSTGTALSSERHLSSENLIPYSNDLSEWSSTTTTTPSTNNLAPDGTNTATAVIENTATSGHNRYTTFSSVSGTNYTFLAFAKANGRTKFQLVAQATSTIANVTFDLTAETSTVTAGSAVSHSITPIGSTGWYRCEVTVTATGTGSNAYHQVNLLDATGANSYTGDGVSGLYFWGMQVSSTGETVLNETSGQIHREYAPTLKTYAANEPRFEYTADGESEGLLIEASATNLLPYGHNGYNSGGIFSMTLVDLSASQNAAVSPSGLLDATLLTDTGGLTQHRIDTAVSGLDTSKKYTLSGYFKATGTTTGFSLRIASGNTYGAEFNFSTGYVSAYGIAPDSYTFETVGNGWVRVSITAPLDLSTATLRINTGRGDVQSDDYSGMLFYGLQFEEGSAPSSVLLTSGSTVTRSADSCSVALGGILADGQDVTLYAEGDFGNPDDKASNRIGALLQKDSSNYITLYNGSGRSGTGYVVNGGAGQAYFTSSVTTGAFKSAISVKPNSFNYASNGIAATEDTSGTVPNYNSLHLGKWYDGTLGLDGTLKRVVLYGQALSSTELAALTS